MQTLVDGPLPAGSRHAAWDGRTAAGRPAPAGIYFYRLTTGGEPVAERKLVIVR